MTFDQFAQDYRVKTRHDECNEPVIPGKLWKVQPYRKGVPPRSGSMYGHHLFENGDGRIGVRLMFYVKNGHEIGGSGKTAKWTNAKVKLSAAGFVITQDGDAEGVALFDPADAKQARLAIKLAGVRVRREMSPEKREALVARLASARAVRAA